MKQTQFLITSRRFARQRLMLSRIVGVAVALSVGNMSRSQTVQNAISSTRTMTNSPSALLSMRTMHALRTLAAQRDLRIGAAVNSSALRDDKNYRETLAREFSIVTPEYVMKMAPLRPSRDTFFWDDADALVDFAQKHQMQIHGHTLVWHQDVPQWIEKNEKSWTRETLSAVLREHIFAVVGRYKGRIKIWDVVNEAVGDDAKMRDTIWRRVIGDDYIALAFRWAHEADPDAILLYNDYNAEGLGAKSDAVFNLVRDLKNEGVPINGVGLQMHFSLENPLNSADFAANMKRLGDLKLSVHVTELDIRVPEPITPQKLDEQGLQFSRVLETFLAAPNRGTFTFWGFSDGKSWIPSFFKGYNAGLLFDQNYKPKPSYYQIARVLKAPTN